jgi:hypothetical protein
VGGQRPDDEDVWDRSLAVPRTGRGDEGENHPKRVRKPALPAAKINPGRCPRKGVGLQAFVRQYRDFMAIILLAAAVINLVAR